MEAVYGRDDIEGVIFTHTTKDAEGCHEIIQRDNISLIQCSLMVFDKSSCMIFVVLCPLSISVSVS